MRPALRVVFCVALFVSGVLIGYGRGHELTVGWRDAAVRCYDTMRAAVDVVAATDAELHRDLLRLPRAQTEP